MGYDILLYANFFFFILNDLLAKINQTHDKILLRNTDYNDISGLF